MRSLRLPDGLRSLGIGGIAVASYGAGSTLSYNELIVYALARRGVQVGAYITHIYVDDATSLRGGREIWGLPKELAEFAWDARGVEVSTAAGSLVRVEFSPALHGCPLPALIPAIGLPNGRARWFWAYGAVWARPCAIHVRPTTGAPFAALGLERPWGGACGPRLDLRVLG